MKRRPLTASLGYGEPDSMEVTFPTVLAKLVQDERVSKGEGLLTHEEGISLMPCNIELSAFEVSMENMMRREYIIKQYTDLVKEDFDYILLDCMPSLGMIMINALTAADSVIIPVPALQPVLCIHCHMISDFAPYYFLLFSN